MNATKSRFRSLALTSAVLLAFALVLFSHTASAKQNPPDEKPPVIGGFADAPLPEDGDISKVEVRGVTEVPEPPPEEEPDAKGAEASFADANTGNNPPDAGPSDKRLKLTVPKLNLKDVLLRNSAGQATLDREGIMHLKGTSFPWQENPNTYIPGHAIGYPGGRVPEAFRNLSSLKKGDRVTLRDARGNIYRYRVYERLLVDPSDYWVTQPVPGKDIVSLQTCYPEPTFEKRLIVRAERVASGGGK